ncbi:MAG: hypothetical protein SW833_16370 [Cyanobacteriota bacterium]|nr:hypothetical protein [Cyanobacteriota bacterium]
MPPTDTSTDSTTDYWVVCRQRIKGGTVLITGWMRANGFHNGFWVVCRQRIGGGTVGYGARRLDKERHGFLRPLSFDIGQLSIAYFLVHMH